jgi:RNA recognition motif-containing protein
MYRNDFAFIEFEDEDSVSYALALLDKVQLFGIELTLTPKINLKVCIISF